ncbi:MAG: glycosyltransferase family 2 protein [Paracoccus sp. (in: a-proteobacteria)]|nr:glycosyltransferase family 2 protein [Paracoccus sp. (in: a-proteobacteria)]
MSVTPPPPVHPLRNLWSAWRARWKRRELLWRIIRARRALTPVQNRTAAIRPGDLLCFAVMRDEALRLPDWLDHYRAMGVRHFLIVDHDSADGTADLLMAAPDVSLWRARGGYRASRFGMDWVGWLLARHGHGHWCLTVDADELLVYPGWPARPLTDAAAALDAAGRPAMGALMLDMFPKGPLDAPIPPGQGMLDHLCWFDAGPYHTRIQHPRLNRWTQGGTRIRAFFTDQPQRGPTLNKLPLVRWNRRWVYVVSTHSILPRGLNAEYDGPGDPRLSGVLLHTKFLPDAPTNAMREAARGEHFSEPAAFGAYYAAVAAAPDLWHPGAQRWTGDWRQLVDLGLMGRLE